MYEFPDYAIRGRCRLHCNRFVSTHAYALFLWQATRELIARLKSEQVGSTEVKVASGDEKTSNGERKPRGREKKLISAGSDAQKENTQDEADDGLETSAR